MEVSFFLLDEFDSAAIASLMYKRKNVKINKIVKNKGSEMVIFEGAEHSLEIIDNWYQANSRRESGDIVLDIFDWHGF